MQTFIPPVDRACIKQKANLPIKADINVSFLCNNSLLINCFWQNVRFELLIFSYKIFSENKATWFILGFVLSRLW